MKILHIINSLDTGGAEKLVMDITPRLILKGGKMEILLLKDVDSPFREKLERSGVVIHTLGDSYYNPKIVFQLIPYLNRYDVIHVHLFPAIYWVAIAKFLACSKTILVLTEHSTNNNRRKYFLFKVLDRTFYQMYDKIIGISDDTTKCLIKHLKCDKRIVTISNGVDIIKIKSSKRADRSSLNCLENDIVLMQIASFRKEKDQATVIRSLSLLPSNYHVIFVGDGELRGACEDLTLRLNLQNRVHFLGVRTDIGPLLRTSDIVIVSSNREGFGLAAVEGMAAQKPVIGTNVDGLKNVISDEELLFENGNKEQLVNIIKKLVTDNVYYKQKADSCFREAEKYDIKRMVDEYDKTYSKLNNRNLKI